ncbi:hypothetical protein BZA05DRAFT_190635 [Tricharina praecox]|uniref:uncharacterized protein n=1 Tax=Tricharina praecox TaxID=43433 RepID=UPI00221EB872|nr:uncharacterized protein BZA05DRAFT_190635 [Tricharina praecox]KAI5842788.1 hypothetical protein BZA05DRAFT_190635 [Tricharina praecox]
MAELKQLLATVLQSIPGLAKRMETATVPTDNADANTIRSGAASFLTTATKKYFRRFMFERSLSETRVYRRAFRNYSTASVRTVDTAGSRFSQLTGLSLAQISKISVIRLPVYSVELNNGDVYDEVQGSSGDGATARRNFDTAAKNSTKPLQRLRNSGTDFATRIRHASTPKRQLVSLLHAAASDGDTAAVEMHIATLGVDVDSRNKDSDTALHAAAEHGHSELVQLLFGHGATIEAKKH